MTLEPQHYITLIIAAVGFIVWLVRLEGRVNALKENGAKHDTTRDEVIRLQEQVKYLTQAVTDLATALKPSARRRTAE